MIRAARYLGVAPWELLERPVCWQEWAICFEKAEGDSVELRAEIAEKQAEYAARDYS